MPKLILEFKEKLGAAHSLKEMKTWVPYEVLSSNTEHFKEGDTVIKVVEPTFKVPCISRGEQGTVSIGAYLNVNTGKTFAWLYTEPILDSVLVRELENISEFTLTFSDL